MAKADAVQLTCSTLHFSISAWMVRSRRSTWRLSPSLSPSIRSCVLLHATLSLLKLYKQEAHTLIKLYVQEACELLSTKLLVIMQ